jgi:SAM-dependent methyltransferase
VERARTVTPVDVSTATAVASIALDGSSPVEVRLHDPNGRRLVGHWVFPPGEALQIDLLSAELCRVDGRPAPAAEVDPDFVPWPRLTFEVNGVPFRLVSDDPEVLRRHYMREGHQEEGYGSPSAFNEAFHQARIRQVRRLFRDVRGTVLDLGSGYSLLGMARPWPFRLLAADWDRPALQEMLRLEWVQGAVACSAEAPAFRRGAFDAVFAGEVIEHLRERPAALRSWVGLLRPGGRLVVTTPNRRHLFARWSGREEVQNAEHLHEYRLDELRSEIEAAGARVRHVEGLCLPLPYRLPGRDWEDAVHTVFCRYAPSHQTALRRLMSLGRPLPRLAMNLAVVAERS